MDLSDFPTSRGGKDIDPKGTYIDYFQGVSGSCEGLANRFGVRLREGFCFAVIQHRDEPAITCSKEFPIPVEIETLPTFVRMIVDDHLLNHPASDLIDVMTGRKAFQQALDSQPRLDRSEWLQNGRSGLRMLGIEE